MSSFTIPLKKVIEITGGTTDLVAGVTILTGGNIGLGYYPIFDNAYKPQLTGRIIDHYFNREIGTESVDMFQLAMRRKMNEIMPYYNKLYLSERLDYDALSTVDLHTISSTNSEQINQNNGNSASESDNESKSRAVTSDTPQTQLSGNEDYATAGADSTGTAHVTATASEESTLNTTGEATGDTRITGYQGAASDLIIRYRESLLNVDMMIINDLEELFMQIWDTADSYTKGYTL